MDGETRPNVPLSAGMELEELSSSSLVISEGFSRNRLNVNQRTRTKTVGIGEDVRGRRRGSSNKKRGTNWRVSWGWVQWHHRWWRKTRGCSCSSTRTAGKHQFAHSSPAATSDRKRRLMGTMRGHGKKRKLLRHDSRNAQCGTLRSNV